MKSNGIFRAFDSSPVITTNSSFKEYRSIYSRQLILETLLNFFTLEPQIAVHFTYSFMFISLIFYHIIFGLTMSKNVNNDYQMHKFAKIISGYFFIASWRAELSFLTRNNCGEFAHLIMCFFTKFFFIITSNYDCIHKCISSTYTN